MGGRCFGGAVFRRGNCEEVTALQRYNGDGERGKKWKAETPFSFLPSPVFGLASISED
jgi:hypothetical protein